MAENYKHLYEQMKRMVEKYQDEIVPGLRKLLENSAPVVRCEDCKYFIVEYWQGEALNHCQNSDGMVEPYPNGFCSYGKKKDGDDDG